jgi:translation initiation factor IF-1
MGRENAIKVEGDIVEVLPNRTYRVQLANGHRLLAFVAGKQRLRFGQCSQGDKVSLELSPYDLSVGRIIKNTQAI